jgi:two-component system NarL family sensor kinase
MSSQANTTGATSSRELERVERAFAESGMPPEQTALCEARASAEKTLATLAPLDREARDAVALLYARSLFAGATSALSAESGRIARLVDRLAGDLAMTRADAARTLLQSPRRSARGERNAEREAPIEEVLLALLEAGDRRVTRLGFDLHDGPLQELLLLGEDMRVLRDQLASMLGEREARLLRGRIEDLEARSVALERGLRQISSAAGARVQIDRPLASALRELTDGFTARTGIVPSVHLENGLAVISPSQRIALLSVVREALNNIREHGRTASEVEISIRLGADGVGAEVRDDGCGFDVDAALLDAARRGRIGLAGIYERVRLLDGECVVESRPGGPTTVALKLPRWELHGGSAAAAGD